MASFTRKVYVESYWSIGICFEDFENNTQSYSYFEIKTLYFGCFYRNNEEKPPRHQAILFIIENLKLTFIRVLFLAIIYNSLKNLDQGTVKPFKDVVVLRSGKDFVLVQNEMFNQESVH